MPNGLKIISEDDFAAAERERQSRWTHRMLTSIEEKARQNEEEGRQAHSDISDKLDRLFDLHAACPGRKYRPKFDKFVVATMAFLGGLVSYILLAKTKLLGVMHSVP